MSENFFGKRLEMLLKENNLTQREAGRLIGVSDVCISRYIKGYRVPKITNVIALSKGLGVTVDYILGFSDSKTYGLKASWTEAKSETRMFTHGGNPVYVCSNCGWVYGSHSLFPTYKFCPNCGKEMEHYAGDGGDK